MNNKKQRCLITGASSGLGKYCALSLDQNNWEIIATGRRSSADANLPKNIQYIAADFANENDVESLAKEVGKCPDLIIHCGVTYPEIGSGVLADDKSLNRVFQINTFAPIRLSQTLLTQKSDSAFASFIFTNSDSMFAADLSSGTYAASKAALRILTTSFAHLCRNNNASSSTLLLGPLASLQKDTEIANIAKKTGLTKVEIMRRFLRKSNPNLVISDFIALEQCLESVLYINKLGHTANGMVCRLDGGSAGSLI